MKQKISLIGSASKAEIINQKTRNRVVVTHQGKVKHGIIVRTKKYNKFNVSYDESAIVIIGTTNRIKGPISKGSIAEVRPLTNIYY
jgi:ribosomal protein L14